MRLVIWQLFIGPMNMQKCGHIASYRDNFAQARKDKDPVLVGSTDPKPPRRCKYSLPYLVADDRKKSGPSDRSIS